MIEHLESLNETWETLRELLTEKGVLIVAVPNCSSYDAKRYGEYWAAYDVPRHLWHFTPGTIQQLASRTYIEQTPRFTMRLFSYQARFAAQHIRTYVMVDIIHRPLARISVRNIVGSLIILAYLCFGRTV